MTPRQHWAAIAQGLQADLQGYADLQALQQAQFHAALRHDGAGMERIAQQILAQAEQLEAARQQRVQHVQALLPAGAAVSMSALFAQLASPLREQMQALWDRLEAQVQHCQQLNVRNCQLILEQAELMRTVIMGPAAAVPEIYAPR